LLKRSFLASGGVDDEVGILHLFFQRHLAAQPPENFLAADSVPLYRPFDLLLGAADGDD
jgi:hypothetical protein